jgi:predicted lipoprotein with Yx(FWY)xxD motif
VTHNRFIKYLARVGIVPLAALAVATSVGVGQAGAATKASDATVAVAKTGLGKVLVDSSGRTLYLFKKDTGTESQCTGACATNWPPLAATGTPLAGTGAKTALIGTTMRADGTSQVTYNGHPVYSFVGDQKAGQTSGEGVSAFGAKWFAVSPSGKQVSNHASNSGSGSSSSGGLGY